MAESNHTRTRSQHAFRSPSESNDHRNKTKNNNLPLMARRKMEKRGGREEGDLGAYTEEALETQASGRGGKESVEGEFKKTVGVGREGKGREGHANITKGRALLDAATDLNNDSDSRHTERMLLFVVVVVAPEVVDVCCHY